MKFAICNEIFQNWPWDKTCHFVRATGYHGIEIAPFTIAPHVALIDDATRVAMRKTAEAKGLDILGLHWLLANVKSDRQLYITHPDAVVRGQTADYFTQLTQLCADLGGRIMVIVRPRPGT